MTVVDSPITDPSPLEERVRFCGLSEQLAEDARRRQAKWAKKRHLKWYIADKIPKIPIETLTAIYHQSFSAWQAVCGLTFTQTMSSASADFIILTRAIDGSGGTLAEHELPNGTDRPVRGWFDVGEKWNTDVALLAVATHEFGHGIGLGHEGSSRVALMDPFYNPRILKPQAWDIEQAVARYGPPISTPDPAPPPVGRKLTIEITDENGLKFKPVVTFPEQS